MLPRFRRGAFASFALVFAVTMLLGDRASLGAGLSLQPTVVLAGNSWWTPLTALLRHPEGLGLLGLLGTLLAQWVIGSRLEGFWGTTRYLVMIFVAGLVAYGGVLGASVLVPEIGASTYSGPGPLTTAAVVAFAWVFASERLMLGSVELSPVLVAGIAAPLSIGFPLLVAVAAGSPLAAAWPTLIPGGLAALVATLFVQPWRTREKSGKVGQKTQRGPSHLRVVRTPEDMLN